MSVEVGELRLSLSQLERLLAAKVGLPLRRLVLWRRMRLANAPVVSGRNLTEAAHGSGFADSALFSRTTRSMLGVRPDRALLRLRAERQPS